MAGRTMTAICTMILIAATMLGRQEGQSTEPGELNHQGRKVNSAATTPDAIKGTNGQFIGAAPNARIRSFFKDNGLPE